MESDYQTVMTVGLGLTTNLHTQPETELLTSELPRPSGRGWQLKQVIPVYNNNRYLQYFWERPMPTDIDDDHMHDDKLQIRKNSIRLSINK